MTYEEIVAERHDRVGIVTLNRPEKRNALSYQLLDDLDAAFDIAEADDSINVVVLKANGPSFCSGYDLSGSYYTSIPRGHDHWDMKNALLTLRAIDAFNQDSGVGAIVITGTDPAFCGGADVGDWKRDLDNDTRESASGGTNWVDFFSASKPIVCAVNGPSIGAGLTFTLSSDARIASDRARFSMRFVRMGLIPELASTKLLPMIVGFSRALELMLTGKTIDAQEAERIGLVSRVVPHDRLLEEAVGLAADMAFNPTESLLAVKKLTWAHMVEADIHKVMTSEGQELMAAALRPSFREAVSAFLEKRQPDFHKSHS